MPLPTAFLILAHDHPGHLTRLANRLRAPWSKIFIHVDRKVDQQPFEQALAAAPVTFLPDTSRVEVHWSGLSHTLAALSLLRAGLPEAQRLCFLSGVDYPIKPIEAIGAALEPDRQFVDVAYELKATDRRLAKFHFNDISLLNPREGGSAGARALGKLLRGLANLRSRTPPAGFRFYHGSGWWSLTKEGAASVIDYVDEHPQILKWLRFAGNSEEILVQSILKQGDLAGAISNDRSHEEGAGLKDAPNHHCACHYIDWSIGDSPKILDLEDLPALKASKALFARKFDPVRSAALLSRLDELIGA